MTSNNTSTLSIESECQMCNETSMSAPDALELNSSWSETWPPPLDLGVFYHPDALIITLYVAVLAASLAANTLLIFIVIKFQYMRSVTNIFLVNLSVADLLVTLFCMPVQIAKAVTLLWYFGEVMCKTVNFLQGVAVASSVFTITAMSVDRYLAITQSLRQPWMPSRRGACSLLAGLWLISLAIFAPLLAVAAVEREKVPLLARTKNSSVLVERSIEFCTEKWPDSIKRELFGTFSFVLVYAIPGHANSAVNPIVYCLMTRNFRRSLRKLVCQAPGNAHSSTHFNIGLQMQGLRQKSNTSSLRTCTTVTFRSNSQLGRGSLNKQRSLRDQQWSHRYQKTPHLL